MEFAGATQYGQVMPGQTVTWPLRQGATWNLGHTVSGTFTWALTVLLLGIVVGPRLGELALGELGIRVQHCTAFQFQSFIPPHTL